MEPFGYTIVEQAAPYPSPDQNSALKNIRKFKNILFCNR